MTPGTYNDIIDRLTADDTLDGDAVELVGAACRGEDALRAALESSRSDQATSVVHPSDHAAPPELPPPAAYLREIDVEGFRGVGPPAKLTFTPGPGLTLVLGRNGSGKSSFSEALELLLTGTSTRWASRSKDWQRDWRNLHTFSSAHVAATFDVQGSEPHVLRRVWKAGVENVGDGELRVRRGRETVADLAALGWAEPLATYRPFLSYSELGAVLDQPSRLYDPLKRILGLEAVAGAVKPLTDARKANDAQRKATTAALADLRTQLAALSEDPRAVRCLEILDTSKPDLDALEEVAFSHEPHVLEGQSNGDFSESRTLATLRLLAQVTGPDLDAIAKATTTSAAPSPRNEPSPKEPKSRARASRRSSKRR